MTEHAGIHRTAIIDSDHVARDVLIGPYVIVGPHVVIADRVRIHAGAVLMGHVEVGAGCEIFPAAVIGKPPARSAALSRSSSADGVVRLGSRCSVGAHAVISTDVTLGEDSLVGDGAAVREGCRIGTRCIVGRAVSLHPDCLLGDATRIMDHSHIATATRTGQDCFISVHVTMVSDPRLGRERFDPGRVRGPVLGNRVAIGAAAIILSGIAIGDDAIVGAGALVTRDVTAGAHVRGNPARAIEHR